ncbi:SelB C-terminal domain-containing protein [Cupriavidus necator]|uniref:SelB domain-containing protein n=1 Tax=Cupriavidus necator TaxID=106590 RepID=UPI0039C29701
MSRKLARHGEAFQVLPTSSTLPDSVRSLALLAAAEAHKDAGTVCAATFRKATGLGGKRAIQVLEFFNRGV